MVKKLQQVLKLLTGNLNGPTMCANDQGHEIQYIRDRTYRGVQMVFFTPWR